MRAHRPRVGTLVCSVATLAAAAVTIDALAQSSASRRPPRPRVTLPDGPVRQILLSSCSGCHGIDELGYYAMSRDHWQALIERMKVTPSGLIPGARIADDDEEILLDWLVTEFGPDAEPFERRYVVREVTDETRLSDAAARARLDEACGGCHVPLEPILSTSLDADGWRSTLTGKIATGTALLIDEVDPLVDWLTRPR